MHGNQFSDETCHVGADVFIGPYMILLFSEKLISVPVIPVTTNIVEAVKNEYMLGFACRLAKPAASQGERSSPQCQTHQGFALDPPLDFAQPLDVAVQNHGRP